MKSETGFDHKLYERFPTEGERPEGELEALEKVWCGPKGWGWFTAINNNYVGILFIGAAFLFFTLAGILALVMRTQLAVPDAGFVGVDTYNQLFTMHGTIMMFLFAVPMVEALAVLLLPQVLGARDLPFPRLGAYALWAYLVGGLIFFCSIFFSLAPDGGWFMYPPLTSKTYSPGINADFWLLGIGFIEISAIAGAIEIIVGVMRTRAPGMTLAKMPIFAWAMLIFAVMIIIAFPSVILATTLMELERLFDWPFFDAARGGDPLLWQHLFWFFGHPEVYIIFLPAAGAMSTMIPVIARHRLVGHPLVVMAMLATGFISFGVWSHHMFTTGMPTMSVGFFSAASMAVSLPAGVQVFAWIATMAAGKMRFNVPGLFILGGLLIFVMGGLTGVMVAMAPFDWVVHDTYFIVAHLHYVLIGGMVFPVFAAIYYWTPFAGRRRLSERTGKIAFWLMFTGMHVTFLPMHLTGLMGMPRRVFTYLPDRGLDLVNLISTVGAFLFALGVLAVIIDLVRNFRPATEGNAGNVFDSPGLEWLPSGLYSTRSIPVVKSLYPLWDNPELMREVKEGRYFLPGTATGERETLITSPLNAEPQYVARMPTPSPWHFWGAIFTAVFFMLLVPSAYGPAAVAGVIAVVCLMGWAWKLDEPMSAETVDVGAGIRLPTYGVGSTSHGWWAMTILLFVAGVVAAMSMFSYVFLWSRRPDTWIDPPAMWSLIVVVGGYVLSIALMLGARKVVRLDRPRMAMIATGMVVLAWAAMAAAWRIDWVTWSGAGLDPTRSGQGATVFSFIGWQGFYVIVCALMTLYVVMRWLRGRVSPARPTSYDVITLFFVFVAAQAGLAALLTRLFPGVVL
ncbi:cbb3-type cytochrome c oxidase subunit I [Brevundimonas sp. BAL450]|uniref:Cytochrome c oxidase polypeptide I / cytochrome c oxidase polypeptide III n=2 Tax=Brevundimonas TaxID=41275 RepID=A0A8E0KKD4_9CAUL|nr:MULTISPECIES: cbb3-type cytochrome c oxidase subunit I [Brevundimonas]MBG7614264.1 cbb3-type cytochrome c oxidase subunit I [Brevundimonas sp. BAL450]GAD58699.1 cytochrome c oxidase polypeptide I / cytochrome c oxidase polypeptide III [Brevundimonas abyssalis TAR-001]